jgi:hypothetical protein
MDADPITLPVTWGNGDPKTADVGFGGAPRSSRRAISGACVRANRVRRELPGRENTQEGGSTTDAILCQPALAAVRQLPDARVPQNLLTAARSLASGTGAAEH